MAKKIRIYTHHRHYHSLGGKKNKGFLVLLKKVGALCFNFFYYPGLGIIKSFYFLKSIIIVGCFSVGSGIISSIITFAKMIKNEFKKTAISLPKRFKMFFTMQFVHSIAVFFVCGALGWGAINSLHLVAKGLQLKDKILHTAFLGNSYLTQAKGALSSQDLGQAQNRFELAYNTFSKGQQDIAQSGQVINSLLSFIPQKKDADKLLAAASLVAKAGQNFVSIDQDFQQLKITGAGINNTGRPTVEIFNDLTTELNDAKSNVSDASEKINSVDINNLPSQNRVNFVQLKDQLTNATSAINNFSSVFSILKAMLIGDKSLLILFENNNELRAGGGFIGTFGLFKVKDGSISKTNVSSVYDLDGQLKDNIKPPKPILNVSERWFLRDSNWFADFPQTAKKVSDFYEREGGETPDLVVAITPNLIIDWLKIVGPVAMPKYGVVLTSDNFIEQTQVKSTLSNNLPTNAPKQILADLVTVLLQKISALDKSQIPAIVQSLQFNLNNKQIVIYSRDAQLEQNLKDFNWAGNLISSDRDYLSIVSSNLGGTKTDLFVDQQISLNSTIGSDGTVTNELTITRVNKMPKLLATANLSYIRVLVPHGSKLLSNIGFDYKNLEYPDGANYKVDDDAYNWEKDSVVDSVSGTVIGAEGSKTFFGNWLNLEGGQTKVIKISYQLPFKLNSIDRYSLLLQKQIGALDQKFNWTLNFSGYQVAWKNFDVASLETNSLTSSTLLNKDNLLGLVLQHR
jgi:hypothetical protein